MTNWSGPQPAPKAMWQVIHSNFPIVRNLGIYNKRVVAGTHTLSHHSEGRALDIGLSALRPDEKELGDALFDLFIASTRELRLDEVIWNRRIWSAARPHVHAHTGQNPHTNHIHIGYTRPGSQATTVPSIVRMRIAALRTGLEDLRRQAIA
jgi:hypothetical protein